MSGWWAVTGGGVIVAPGVNVMSGAFTCIIIWYLLYRQSLPIDSRRVLSFIRCALGGSRILCVNTHCVSLYVVCPPAGLFVLSVDGTKLDYVHGDGVACQHDV